MREILFRAKIKKDNGNNKKGDWVYGHYCELKDGRNIIPCIYGFGEVDKKTLGQYTGLTDKNGKKIFDGDILKATDEKARTYIYKVVFINGIFGLVIKHGGYACPVVHWANNCIEVIGNIHDNPELLNR